MVDWLALPYRQEVVSFPLTDEFRERIFQHTSWIIRSNRENPVAFSYLFSYSSLLYTNCAINKSMEPEPTSQEQKTKKNWLRRHPILSGLIGLFLFFFIVGTIGGATNKNTPASTAGSGTPPQSNLSPTDKQKTTVTPTSKDPCSAYYGTSQLGDCMKLQNAMDKGAALDHPLSAKVSYDSTGLYITNTENTEWDQCTATINETDPSGDNFQSDGFVIGAGQRATVKWADIVNRENQRFIYVQTKPYSLDLDCKVGGQTDKNSGAFTGAEEHRSLFNL